ncbi:hypothetical protein HPP92_000362 [Vanilla planifolia]|uniref:Uncharacterized protein n=1 Tax=Vanilla planifolia TaxID=51239 RepID=A0A835VKD8_VANPL|nr:hypothetical protein HPP92_000362 [Vanilla planifolia]
MCGSSQLVGHSRRGMLEVSSSSRIICSAYGALPVRPLHVIHALSHPVNGALLVRVTTVHLEFMCTADAQYFVADMHE